MKKSRKISLFTKVLVFCFLTGQVGLLDQLCLIYSEPKGYCEIKKTDNLQDDAPKIEYVVSNWYQSVEASGTAPDSILPSSEIPEFI